MSDKVKVFALGGLDEIGKDLICVEINDDIFILECGLKYPDKTAPGVDYIIPNTNYLKNNKHRVKAYLLTHGHDMSVSGIAYMYKDVPAPIYCTNATKIIIEAFCEHIKLSGLNFKFNLVEPSSNVRINNRKVSFFQTANNMANSFGICIDSDVGNIVFVSDFVIDHNTDRHFFNDIRTVGKLSDKNTLLLMCGSIYADRPGYTAPRYKLGPLLDPIIKDINGRLFIATSATDAYNFSEIIKMARKYKKVIIPYTKSSYNDFTRLCHILDIDISQCNMGEIEDINRYSSKEVLVFVTGYGSSLFKEIIELAQGRSNKRINLSEKDTFIQAVRVSNETEVIATDTLDILYKTGCNVHNFKNSSFLNMHASEEDLKAMIALFQPKYYLPIEGSYRNLLSNARMSVNMGIGLTHGSVFVLDNGMILEFIEGKARLLKETIEVGDILVDGKGIGDIDTSIIEERQKIRQDGVVIIGMGISRIKKQIVAGPDIQMRGFVMLKESEPLLKSITLVLEKTLLEELKRPSFSLENIKYNVSEVITRHIRKETGKMPLIVPFITIIED